MLISPNSHRALLKLAASIGLVLVLTLWSDWTVQPAYAQGPVVNTATDCG